MLFANRQVLLIIGGGIAAYKVLDLTRRLRERGARVRTVMTAAAREFVTPLSVGALTGEKPFTDLFDPASEFDVGHIRLAREADVIVVAPATADLIARMAGGQANDLATAVLLATRRPVLLAPAMNPAMWEHPAVQRNIVQLLADGISTVGPNKGEMAESNEAGTGRMAEPMEILAAVENLIVMAPARNSLQGKRVLVTSGPTREPIDPVRFISNHSSGKQGHAVARAAAAAGAEVILISGPVDLPDPSGVRTIHVETAAEMLKAAEAALPADVAICAAAVADWKMAQTEPEKMKKADGAHVTLSLSENPDILKTIAGHQRRPKLVVGFAAETEKILDHAKAKLAKKGCDWIVANDVSPQTGVFGGNRNTVHLVTREGVENWPTQSKEAVAVSLVKRIADTLKDTRI